MRQIANLLTGFFPGPRVRIPPCPPPFLARTSGVGGGRLLLLAALILLPLLPGCVTRKLFLRTEPPGAEVILDGQLVGETPYEETFLSYGVRRVELRLEGHRRRVELLDVERPWWQYLPFALFTDVLWPFDILDEHHFAFDLAERGESVATWEDARAAYERMLAHKGKVTAAPEGADVDDGVDDDAATATSLEAQADGAAVDDASGDADTP